MFAASISEYFSRLYSFPTDLVNNSVQMFRVEWRGLLLIHSDSKPFQLGQDVLNTTVILDTVVHQLVQGLRHRIVHIAADGVGGKPPLCVVRLDEPRRNTNRSRSRRHRLDHDGVRTDLRAVSDADRPQDLGAGADDHTFAEC